MSKFLMAAVAVVFLSAFSVQDAQAAQTSNNGLITKSSSFDVKTTVDRLKKIFRKKGITIFATVDHAAGGNRVGIPIPPTVLVIFGNPKLGTPLMQSSRTVAIDLPQKALVWKDARGTVWLTYNNPYYLAKRHGIKDRAKILAKIAGVLNKLTNAAIKP